jgi:uncharacterized repeat protein (TIGR01451 family)
MGKQVMIALCCIALLGQVGCECLSCKDEPAPAPVPVKAAEPKPAPAPVQAPNMVSRVYGDSAGCGAVRIDKQLPATVALGQPFSYTITATNLTDMELSQIIVNDRLPGNFEFKIADPAATPKDGLLTWVIDTLGPNASKKMTVNGTAKEVGWVQTCADATYVILACAKTQVVQPALLVQKSAPAEVLLCDQIALKYVVSNKGTGTASNVVITDTLPEGLTQASGQKTVDIKVGDLAPGKSMTYTVMAKAAKTGSYKSSALAKADGNLKSETEATTTAVKQPILVITKTGPEKQYLGRKVNYEITVSNKGDAPATNVALTDSIPAGVTEAVASEGGQIAGTTASWNLGTIAAGQSRKVTIGYLPQAAGAFSNTASVVATCAESVKASAKTEVSGIAGILLEMIDVTDPLEVGQNETYIITVTNQGTAPDTDIKIVCKLEDSMQFVSASGATAGTHADGVVTFQPLATLAPKAKAVWKVEVKAIKPGDVRFHTTLTTKQLGREVIKTEATNFYQ